MMAVSVRDPNSSMLSGSSRASVEGFDEGVLPGGARLDIGDAGAVHPAPVPQGPGHELGAVVAAQVVGPAALGHQGFDDLDEMIGGAGAPDPHG
jgi:hypothetical protein